MAALNDILNWFKKGLVPTEEQFRQAWSSFRHKDVQVPIADVKNLSMQLNSKLGTTHTSDETAHTAVLLKKDGSNLNDADKAALKMALDVGEIPDNVALVDMGEPTDVFNKDQIRALYMSMADYIVGGKIRADKIEALGLTTLIEVSQTSLASFAANSANYVFEQNDIIAIPDGTGNFALFIFKGGTKTVTANYLPTGLTNITIAMVEGLQTALDSKVQKPAGTGGFFASQSGTTTTWVQISPASYYLNLWDGSNFRASVLYQNGTKLGIGTQTPSEMLHLQDGRLRAKAIVLDVNSETLPNQITTDGTRFSGASSGGTKRGLMYNDYADFLALSNSLTDAQKTAWKTSMNGGWTTNTMSVGAILPPVADNSDKNYWFTLKGANLNFLSTSFKVEIMDSTGTTVVAEVPNAQVQLYANGTDLVFYYNLKDLPTGQYRLRLWNGVAYYTTGAVVSITIVSNLTAIPLGGLTWSSIQKTAGVADVVNGSGNAINLNIKSANYALQNTGEIVGGLKSSQIVGANVNFYLKGNFTHFGGLNSIAGAIVGVGEDNPLTFANTNSAFVTGKGQAGINANGKFFLPGLSSQGVYYPNIFNGYDTTITNTGICEFIIIRNGNNASIIVRTNNTTAVSLQTITERALHIFSYLLNGGESGSTKPTQSSIALIEGYEF